VQDKRKKAQRSWACLLPRRSSNKNFVIRGLVVRAVARRAKKISHGNDLRRQTQERALAWERALASGEVESRAALARREGYRAHM
jgi:hypothetical protein